MNDGFYLLCRSKHVDTSFDDGDEVNGLLQKKILNNDPCDNEDTLIGDQTNSSLNNNLTSKDDNVNRPMQSVQVTKKHNFVKNHKLSEKIIFI